EEHRLDHGCAGAQHPRGELELEQRDVGVRPDAGTVNPELGQRVGVEVAVAAAHCAERDMDVDAKRPGAQRFQRLGRKLSGRRGRFALGQGTRHTSILAGEPRPGAPAIAHRLLAKFPKFFGPTTCDPPDRGPKFFYAPGNGSGIGWTSRLLTSGFARWNRRVMRAVRVNEPP